MNSTTEKEIECGDRTFQLSRSNKSKNKKIHINSYSKKSKNLTKQMLKTSTNWVDQINFKGELK